MPEGLTSAVRTSCDNASFKLLPSKKNKKQKQKKLQSLIILCWRSIQTVCPVSENVVVYHTEVYFTMFVASGGEDWSILSREKIFSFFPQRKPNLKRTGLCITVYTWMYVAALSKRMWTVIKKNQLQKKAKKKKRKQVCKLLTRQMLHHLMYDDDILDRLLEPNTAALFSTFHASLFSRLCVSFNVFIFCFVFA